MLLAYLDAGRPGRARRDIAGAAAGYMLAWLDGDWPNRKPGSPPRDIGGATRAGLEAYRRSRDPRAAGAGQGQAGNGSLMRCIPTGLAVADGRRRISESIEISAITHDDERAVSACAAYNEIVAALVDGAGQAAAVAAGLDTARALGSEEVAAAIAAGRELDPAGLAESGDLLFPGQASGYVLDSLTLAVAAVGDPRPLAGVLADIARLGHDADTNAAIAGGLLGARDGAAAIPARWTAVLQFGAEFAAAAPALAGLRAG